MMKRWTECSWCYGNVMKIHKHINRNRDALDYMGVPDQPSHCGSHKPTFSQVTQAVPEIWPVRWTEYSYCYGNEMKIHKDTSRNRDTLIL